MIKKTNKQTNTLGQLFKRSLVKRALSHFQFAERFYVNTVYREQFH